MARPKYAERLLSMGSKRGVGQINQNAVEIKKKPVSCGGLPFRRCWARNPAMRCSNVRSSAQSLMGMTGVLSVNDDLCVITICRCGDRWNYADTIKGMLDKSLHLRWRHAEKLCNLCF